MTAFYLIGLPSNETQGMSQQRSIGDRLQSSSCSTKPMRIRDEFKLWLR